MIKAKKSLGQNFLHDRNILAAIIKTADISEGDRIIEIGPGTGILTEELAKKTESVTAIELDQRLIPLLQKNLPKNVKIIHGDALKFSPPDSPYKIVANIPYYITSPLINHFLQNKNKPHSMTLLTQYEVAKKICQLEPDMSVLSLQVALFGRAKLIKKVSRGAFKPQPKVDSAILHIKVAPTCSDQEAQKILALAKQAFSQGRKKLSNTLKKYKIQLTQLHLEHQRPQHLSLQDWQKLAAIC